MNVSLVHMPEQYFDNTTTDNANPFDRFVQELMGIYNKAGDPYNAKYKAKH